MMQSFIGNMPTMQPKNRKRRPRKSKSNRRDDTILAWSVTSLIVLLSLAVIIYIT